jgi:hypothetical protein
MRPPPSPATKTLIERKQFFDSNHGPGRTAMFDAGISLVELPWMQIRRRLTVESELPSTDCHDHDLNIH